MQGGEMLPERINFHSFFSVAFQEHHDALTDKLRTVVNAIAVSSRKVIFVSLLRNLVVRRILFQGEVHFLQSC